jgi:uncharacterized membrane protein YkvA (DUF1232 family)
MAEMMSVAKTLIGCGTLLTLAFVVLLAMPQSKLRAFLLPIVGWMFAIFCGLYCISPVDIVPEALLGPFGLVDDIGAAVVGIASGIAAHNASKAG